ncbi:hypothetical protein COCON_G00161560 [Conger conger]|uniref:[histone H4]-lysine(20) N-methyltransferase n=1 Tax=Conger conger TaxID=82655 RepID=A0A9Q1DAT6_CONCO|nr:hypothetical protein COCON_G00161560 [Conger conger]
MGKGKKVQPEDAPDIKGKETKENHPKMNGEGLCCGQTTIRSFLSPAKPRSPLVDHSLLPDAKCSSKHSAQKEPDRKGEGRLDVLPEGEEAGSPGRARGTEEVLAGEEEEEQTSETSGKRQFPEPKVTDYFPIRRSSRKSRAELKSEEHRQIEDLIQKGVEDGLEVRHIEGKGRGVFADGSFRKGQFVVEYHGDLLEIRDAKRREEEYGKDPATGCYMYYFQYHNKTYCVDATKETERVGRLINHSKNGNCQTKLHGIDGRPHLILVASRDIEKGEELLYDYGDRSKESIAAHPWLKH